MMVNDDWLTEHHIIIWNLVDSIIIIFNVSSIFSSLWGFGVLGFWGLGDVGQTGGGERVGKWFRIDDKGLAF